MDIDLDRPEAIRSRVKRIIAGDFDYSHFATTIMWLRERVAKNSTLHELGDFLAHPYRDRGPTSAAVSDLLMDFLDNLEVLDPKKVGAELAERAVKVEEMYFEFRQALLDAGLLLAEEDEALATAYEAFVSFYTLLSARERSNHQRMGRCSQGGDHQQWEPRHLRTHIFKQERSRFQNKLSDILHHSCRRRLADCVSDCRICQGAADVHCRSEINLLRGPIGSAISRSRRLPRCPAPPAALCKKHGAASHRVSRPGI
ncbi:hypothetical protein [Rhizobium bangladeshense]|uniref:hypothetical protein n=1 Tax=Rhizobium bangladeshense TaxID=1138189 RepID=UPI001C9284A4|nr:hypothetical protein [Rhizobium bangladeshense]MBY3594523.1 hypothetical protein [Rhizobium bangladeshense]